MWSGVSGLKGLIWLVVAVLVCLMGQYYPQFVVYWYDVNRIGQWSRGIAKVSGQRDTLVYITVVVVTVIV